MADGIYCIGLDFGTDSVRTVLVNVLTGEELASTVVEYPRWKAGLYCDATKNQFRQHPQDYIDSMTQSVRACLDAAGPDAANRVAALSATCTGSTPVAVNDNGIPLSLIPDMADNPNAMFFLWKDHSAQQEATDINTTSSDVDYLKYAGGIYSSEWFWAKLLYALRHDEQVRSHCYTWVEHCDWIPFLLTGQTDVRRLKRNVCAAGHKALWAAEHGGFPDPRFLHSVDPLLEKYGQRMNPEVYTADQSAGCLSQEWADRLGLSSSVKVGIGAIDAHVGAIGAQIEPGYLTKIIGTSTCDMMVVPVDDMKGKFVKGICGQVEGSIIPGMMGLEAGQSAFGDVYSWFRQILTWPLQQAGDLLSPGTREMLEKALLQQLDAEAAKVNWTAGSPLAVDWLNGRRTPDANLLLKGAVTQLSLGTTAPDIYASLVEATCFGSRRIVERFNEQGIAVKGITGVGGIAKKSPFVIQMMADVLEMPIRVSRSEQICAAGATMMAATIAGVFRDIPSAMQALGSGFDRTYLPQPERAAILRERYRRYCLLGDFLEWNQ